MLRLHQQAGRRLVAAATGSTVTRAVSSSAATPAPQQDLKLKASPKGVRGRGRDGREGGSGGVDWQRERARRRERERGYGQPDYALCSDSRARRGRRLEGRGWTE